MTSQPILFLRSCIFYLGYGLTLVPHATICVIIGKFLPIKARYNYFVLWNRFSVWWVKICCGVSYQIHGLNNVPTDPYVLLSNHQSPWETLFLYYEFRPLCATLKKELLRIPFFGWGLSLLEPIAIDRSKRRGARQTLMNQGKLRLADGISVLVFPEGTRVEPGQVKKFSSGGAELAIQSGAKILPVAHNAGQYWPARKFIKTPGTIDVFIGEPVSSDNREARELTEEIECWIRATLTTG